MFIYIRTSLYTIMFINYHHYHPPIYGLKNMGPFLYSNQLYTISIHTLQTTPESNFATFRFKNHYQRYTKPHYSFLCTPSHLYNLHPIFYKTPTITLHFRKAKGGTNWTFFIISDSSSSISVCSYIQKPHQTLLSLSIIIFTIHQFMGWGTWIRFFPLKSVMDYISTHPLGNASPLSVTFRLFTDHYQRYTPLQTF